MITLEKETTVGKFQLGTIELTEDSGSTMIFAGGRCPLCGSTSHSLRKCLKCGSVQCYKCGNQCRACGGNMVTIQNAV